MAWISVKFYFSVALNVCRTFAEVFFNLLKKKDVFINMGPFGSKYIESLLLPQTTFEYFRTFSEFSSQLSTHKDSVGFLKFWVYKFSGFFFFSFSLTWDPLVAKISKRYSSLKSLLNLFKLILNFLRSCPHKSTVSDFLSFWFLTIFLIHHCSIWRNQKPQIIWKTSDRRAKWSEILGSEYCMHCIQSSFDS